MVPSLLRRCNCVASCGRCSGSWRSLKKKTRSSPRPRLGSPRRRSSPDRSSSSSRCLRPHFESQPGAPCCASSGAGATHGCYGVHRIRAALRCTGNRVSPRRILRFMASASIRGGARRGRSHTTRADGSTVASDLVKREFRADRPNPI